MLLAIRPSHVLIMNHPAFLDPIVAVVHLLRSLVSPWEPSTRVEVQQVKTAQWCFLSLVVSPVDRGTADEAIRRATTALSQRNASHLSWGVPGVRSCADGNPWRLCLSPSLQGRCSAIGALDIRKNLMIKPVKRCIFVLVRRFFLLVI